MGDAVRLAWREDEVQRVTPGAATVSFFAIPKAAQTAWPKCPCLPPWRHFPAGRNFPSSHGMAGLSHKEIAEDLGISVANSRVLLHRGRAAFQDILKENCVLTLGRDEVPSDRRQKGEQA